MLDTAVYTDIGGREANEDSARIRRSGPDSLICVVADGLGGHGGGEIASGRAADTIVSGWDGMASAGELTELIRRAHAEIKTLQTRGREMMTTAVVLALEGASAVWAHAGDSRLYRFKDGELAFQTRDHSASQAAVLLGDITPDQIRFHPDRSRVLRALGQSGELNVTTGSERLTAGKNAFLLCTDGFWEYVYESEMAQTLREASGPADWLERMRALHAQRTPQDNDNNTAAAVWLYI